MALAANAPSDAASVAPSATALADAAEDGPRFSARQFLQQALLQFTYPLSVLPAALFLSRGFALNLLGVGAPFRPAAVLPTVLFFVFSLAPFVVVAAYAAAPTNANSWVAATLRSDTLHVAIAFISQRLTVSIKYAFIPRAAYLSRLARWTPSRELQAEQLVTGWFHIDKRIIAREVDVAVALRQPSAPREAFELHDAALPRLLAVLRATEARAVLDEALGGAVARAAADSSSSSAAAAAPAADASACEGAAPVAGPPLLRVPVVALVNAIMLEAISRERQFGFALQAFLFLVAFCGTFTTTFIRAAVGAPLLGLDALEALVIVGHWVANLIIMPVTFSFLAIGAIDHRRRATSHRLLGELFRALPRGCPPALAFESTAQACAFLTARSLLLAFGEAFHERLVLVISTSLVVFAALSAYCLATLYTSTSAFYVVSSIVLLHVLVLPSFLCSAFGLFEAGKINEHLRKHVSLVVDARVRLRLAACALAPLDARVLGLLEDVERLMVEQQNSHPVAILGIPASAALFKSFVGTYASLETAALTAVFIWAGARKVA